MKDLQEQIDRILLDLTNDLTDYLESDVPLECYAEDIAYKLDRARDEVANAFDAIA